MRNLCKSLAAAAISLACATSAHAYEGAWRYDGGVLILGDDNDGTGLYLSNSGRYCGQPASLGSAEIRAALRQTNRYGDGRISWYIDEECDDGYVRICIRRIGCNTYRYHDWAPFRVD